LLISILFIAVFGPAATKWYSLLQHHVKLSSPVRTTVSRVALDQFVFTPINMLFFLSSMSFMEGWPPTASNPATNPASIALQKTPADQRIKEKLSSTYVQAYKSNLMIWPWVQLANFSVVPLEHRVLVVNVVALGWNCYLSWLNNKSES
jgi:protein Mpv17